MQSDERVYPLLLPAPRAPQEEECFSSQGGLLTGEGQAARVVEGEVVEACSEPIRGFSKGAGLLWLVAALVTLVPLTLLLAWWVVPVRIVITPVRITRASGIVLQATTGSGAIKLRLLSTSAESPAPVHVEATGQTVRPARAASGMLTYYNQEPYSQKVALGTILEVTSTLELETDQDVVIPPAQPPDLGIASGWAHALSPGPRGNIPPGSLNRLCACGTTSVVVKNLAPFTGGQDQATIITLSAGDVDRASREQHKELVQQAKAQLRTLLTPPDEDLGPAACNAGVTANPPVGSVTREATVVVHVSCAALAFHRHAVEREAATHFVSQVGSVPRQRLTRMSATILQASADDKLGFLSFSVLVRGTWVYQLNRADVQAMQRQVAGKSSAQALVILAHVPGVAAASVEQIVPWFTLPADPGHIMIQCLTYT